MASSHLHFAQAPASPLFALTETSEDLETQPTHLNPLLTTLTAPFKRESNHILPTIDFQHLNSISISPSVLPPGASALRMYLCQRPQRMQSLDVAFEGECLFPHIYQAAGIKDTSAADYKSQRFGEFCKAAASYSTGDDYPAFVRTTFKGPGGD